MPQKAVRSDHRRRRGLRGVDVDKSLFDLTPPEGYTVQSFDVDASPPQEKDLVAAFKSCAEIGEGMFPDTLDTAGITKLLLSHAIGQGVKDNDLPNEKYEAMMKQSLIIGRGIGFGLQLPEAAEAHYAGKEVKQCAKDAPIFWYKPEGKTTYRVIYADLNLKDAAAAPPVKGALRLQKTSKAKPPQGF